MSNKMLKLKLKKKTETKIEEEDESPIGMYIKLDNR